MSIPDYQVEVEDVILHLKERLQEALMDAVVLHSALDKAERENTELRVKAKGLNVKIAELEAACQQVPRKARPKSAR